MLMNASATHTDVNKLATITKEVTFVPVELDID